MGKLLIYCYSITFFEIIVIVSAIKKIVIATWSVKYIVYYHYDVFRSDEMDMAH